MHVMGVGTVVDPTGARLGQVSGVIAATATTIAGSAEDAIGTKTGTTTATGVATGRAFLTPYRCIRIMAYPAFADVAELADAQVSEACDGDIVEVQVLSSAPKKKAKWVLYVL